MVVEDNIDLQLLYVECLTSEGYTVLYAENGKVALELLRSFKELPTIILLDLMMPVMTGWEFLKIVQSDEKLMNIPVVVCSAATENLPTNVQIITKPVNHKTLLSVAQKYGKGA